MAKSYWMETYGCQMNIAESQALENVLQDSGWVPAENENSGDVVILNTCSVRKTAESRIWGRLGFFSAIKAKRSITIIVMGCMGERLREEFKKEAPMVDYVFGTQDQHLIPGLLLGESAGEEGAHSQDSSTESYSFRKSHRKEGSFKAFVPIMHGCNNFCTYCIVPYVRGRERSRDPKEIVAEVQELAREGVKKITLLGQNVNSYQWDGLSFPELLQMVAQNCGDIQWIDFLSSHPKDLSPELIRVMAEEPKITRNLHLPVQHGSDAMLQAMNRRYTAAQYLELVDRLRKAIPDLTLTSDIMVGFPGETEADVEQLKELMRTAQFIQSFTYYYNPREGTKAAEFTNQLSDREKKDRLADIIALQHEIGHTQREKLVGKELLVLVEGVSKKADNELLGRSQSDLMVVFPSTNLQPGACVLVKIESVQGNTLRGKLVEG